MKILVIGSGGREHALAWKIAQSEREIAKEEDRRNALAHVMSSYQSTPNTPVLSSFSPLSH